MKLTEDQRKEIRRRFKAGEKPTALAKDFHVSAPTIYNVVRESRSLTTIDSLKRDIENDEKKLAEFQKLLETIEDLRRTITKKKEALVILSEAEQPTETSRKKETT